MSVFREYGTQDFSTERKLGEHLTQISLFTGEKMDSGLPNFLQLSYGRGMLGSIMNIWKQPRCPSSREWINKVIIPQQLYTGEHDAWIGLSVPLTSF